MLFSHVKISSFRATAHLVFHWWFYNEFNYMHANGLRSRKVIEKKKDIFGAAISCVFRKLALAPSNLGCLFTRFRPCELASPLSITHCQGLIRFTELSITVNKVL